MTSHDLTDDAADAVIDQEIAHFSALGKEFEWKVFSFDSPPNLVERLRAKGFAIGAKEGLVVFDLAGDLGSSATAPAFEVRRITQLEQLSEFRSVAERVFAKDYSFTTNQLADALSKGEKGHDGYVGYSDGIPVCVGRLYTDPASAFAGLYGGGTLAEHRRRGFYRAMVAARARDARIAGARYALVDALPTSLPVLVRMGFAHLADSWPCVFKCQP